MILTGFESITWPREPLAIHTTFGIGGPAEVFVIPRTVAELRAVVSVCSRLGLPLRVLGRGSNLLVADEGVHGVVVFTQELDRIEQRGTAIIAQAGAFVPALVRQAAKWGLAGLEPLVGIPGTVGGALAMNAGGRHGTISAVLRRVTVIERDGALSTLDRAAIEFAHRHSSLKGRVIAEAEFSLSSAPPGQVVRRCESILADKKRTQPMSARSAGCMFRNPPGASAGALIDRAQLKSHRVGGAHVSAKHANFIVNDGTARARDVLALMRVVRSRVAEQFHVQLENEVELWGFDQPRAAK